MKGMMLIDLESRSRDGSPQTVIVLTRSQYEEAKAEGMIVPRDPRRDGPGDEFIDFGPLMGRARVVVASNIPSEK